MVKPRFALPPLRGYAARLSEIREEMEMNMRLGGICLLLAAVAMTAGCLDQSKSEPQAKPKPQVAVVNLDTIADAMGMKAEVAGQIQADEQGLRQQLAQIQQSLQKQLQEKRAAYGEEMTEDQQKELTQLVNQANAQMNQLRQRAQALASRYAVVHSV